MEVNESTAERRARLKLLAKKRAAQLASGETPLPHTASSEDRATADSGVALTRTLIDSGRVSFRIECHNFEIEETEGEPAEGQRLFLLRVDDIYVEANLLSFRVPGGHSFSLFGYGALKNILHDQGFDPHRKDNIYILLYNILFCSATKQSFLEYLAKRARDQRETLNKIIAQAERFKDTLVRKYKQLVFTDDYETKDESRFIDELKRFAASRLGDVEEKLVVLVTRSLVVEWVESSPVTQESLAFDPNMSPVEYEQYCADLLNLAGWSTQLTAASGDQGADVICSADGFRLVVQCKLYGSPVGNSAVQEVIAAKQFEYADAAAVVSNAPFTRSAKELANVAKVLLLHHDVLHSLSPKALAVGSNKQE